jgi:hypothetical protein
MGLPRVCIVFCVEAKTFQPMEWLRACVMGESKTTPVAKKSKLGKSTPKTEVLKK